MRRRPEIEEAFWRAWRTTLVGSTTPLLGQVAVLQGGGVEAVARALDLGGDDGALEARVLRDGLDRSLDRLADDRDADRLVTMEAQAVERLGGEEQGGAAAGHDALLERRAGGGEGVLDAGLLLLERGLGGRADLQDGDAAAELGLALLQLLLVVGRVRGLDLRLDSA